jgi:dihydrofolate synthase/folylpolyglutamate synthase
VSFASFSAVQSHLDTLGLFHMDFSPGRMEKALTALGLYDRMPICVQIVGTNGKGSTACFLESLARFHAVRTGLYTSPHLARVNERIRIDAVPLPEDLWPRPAGAVHTACPELTYFEFLTVLAVAVFVEHKVECVIMEAGLGGQYDATTAVPADLVCFTPMAVDHAAILGPTLRRIAADKSRAMRRGGSALAAPQRTEAGRILREEAGRKDCDLVVIDETRLADMRGRMLGLAGPHQRINAALAMEAWRRLAALLGRATDPAREDAALAAAFIPGRLQSIPARQEFPPLLLDGAHNPHGMDSLETALKLDGIVPRAVIFACMADKDPAMLAAVNRMAGHCPLLLPELPGNARAAGARDLARRFAGRSAPLMLADDLARALAATRTFPARESASPVVVCGSLYLLGEFFRRWPEYLVPSPNQSGGKAPCSL